MQASSSTAGLKRVSLESNDASDTCRKCRGLFAVLVWRHHCYACGLLHCATCAPVALYLEEYDAVKRVCEACLRIRSNLDFSRHVDETLPPAGIETRACVVLVHGALGTRKSFYFISGLLAKSGICVVALDLPGHGSRRGELQTETSACNCVLATLRDVKQRWSLPVFLLGYSMGGSVVLKTLHHARAETNHLCDGIILSSCINETTGLFGKAIFGAMGLVYTASSFDYLANLLQTTFPDLPKNRLQEAFLKSAMDYSLWPQNSAMMLAPSATFYSDVIRSFTGRVLFTYGTGRGELASALNAWQIAAGPRGQTFCLDGATHCMLIEDAHAATLAVEVATFMLASRNE